MTGPLVVVGDALLDVDLDGTADRLAPDAPAPVLGDVRLRLRPGGAGLAAELAARDGAEVVLVTALGDDEAAEQLASALSPRVRLLTIPYDGGTPVKQRVRAQGRSLVRLDAAERPGHVGEPPAVVRSVLSEAAAVLVSDYGRGVAAQPALRSWLSPARSPLVWDPHPRGPQPVPGAQLVSPNDAEVSRLAGGDGASSPAALEEQAARLLRSWQAHAVAVTLGERGVLLSHGDGAPMVVPAPTVPCLDPCGAGDRFAASAALALGSGAVTSEAVQQAVLDAAGFVAAGGASAVGRAPEEWSPYRRSPGRAGAAPHRRETGRPVVVATGGCFDLLHAGHVATLEAARALGDRLVVCLNSDASVRRLKGPGRPVVPEADRARLVGALSCVDEVMVFDEDTPVEALRRLKPDLWVKGGDYAGAELPENDVLREWGGQAVVVPYLEGRSTTGLVARAGRG